MVTPKNNKGTGLTYRDTPKKKLHQKSKEWQSGLHRPIKEMLLAQGLVAEATALPSAALPLELGGRRRRHGGRRRVRPRLGLPRRNGVRRRVRPRLWLPERRQLSRPHGRIRRRSSRRRSSRRWRRSSRGHRAPRRAWQASGAAEDGRRSSRGAGRRRRLLLPRRGNRGVTLLPEIGRVRGESLGDIGRRGSRR